MQARGGRAALSGQWDWVSHFKPGQHRADGQLVLAHVSGWVEVL